MTETRHFARCCLLLVLALGAAAPALAQHPDVGEEKPPNEMCLGCHEDLQKSLGDKPHKAVDLGCISCHDLKGAKAPFLRGETVNGLCSACHNLPPLPPDLAAKGTVSVGGFTVERAALVKTQLRLDASGRGHPMTRHPTSGPSDPLNKDKPFTCLSCHVPHGGTAPKLLAFTLKPGEGICQLCHKM